MKVLMISSDRKVFEEGSAVRARLLDYGRLVEALHVIVFAKGSLNLSEGTINPNIFLYPTQSLGKVFHILNAIVTALKLKKRGVTIDVVTTQDPFEAGLAGYLIARIFNARLHIQIHTDVMSPYFAHESILNRSRVFIAKILIPRVNAIRVVSERIKTSLVASGYWLPTIPISVLPIFVETKNNVSDPGVDLKKKYPQFDFHILVASRLSREKNIGSVIDAMQSVIVTHPMAGLIIVGDGPEREALALKAKTYNLQANVLFDGWQDNLAGYYKTADVFVLSSFYEGYGMTVMEALTQGCPVIMTDVGCAKEALKDPQNGIIVPVGDTKALSQALEGVVLGKLKFAPKTPILPTKEEYLAMYKKSWEDALLSSHEPHGN